MKLRIKFCKLGPLLAKPTVLSNVLRKLPLFIVLDKHINARFDICSSAKKETGFMVH